MSRELTKMNLIAIVQQLPKDDIEVIQTYIGMLEQENADLKQRLNVVNEMNVANYNKYCETLKENQLLKEQLKAELKKNSKAIEYIQEDLDEPDPEEWKDYTVVYEWFVELLEILGGNNE